MIRFKDLIPYPLAGTELSDSGLWACKEQYLQAGESCLLHSPSGKGKSSFLAFVYGIRKDFHGQIELFGKDTHDYTAGQWEQIRQKRISMVFQGLRLFPTLTGIDNIRLKNQITGFRTEEEILNMAEALEVQPFLKQKLATLSFGQQQRIAIIRALCQPYELLLLDEPFSHIDKELQSKVWKLVSEDVKKQNAGLIITSLDHNKTIETDKIIQI